MSDLAIDRLIEFDPAIFGGKPRIAGHPITVQTVVVWHERLGLSPEAIASTYNLSLAEVHAALAYYFDHRAEMEQPLEQAENPTRLQQKRHRKNRICNG